MWNWLYKLASPPYVYGAAAALAPWFLGSAAITIVYGLVAGLAFAPPDYQQGDAFRIIYVHAPSAWMSLFAYTSMAVAGAIALIWRIKMGHAVAAASAPIGASFTLLALVTGSLWGRPMWGTYWVWDARLTSVFVLFLMYLGVIALWRTIDDPTRAGRVAAILTLVGAINIPIIKFSVDWWNTLHQPASVVKMDGPAIHSSILMPLLVMAIAATLLFVTLHVAAMRNEILKRRVRSMQMMQAELAPGR
jgi:heme exporter protein C